MGTLDLGQLFSSDQLILASDYSILEILLSLMITFLISLFIYFVYKKTYSGVLYSQNFNVTLVMTALIVNAIMIGISGNIVLSLGMVGALSIVRFRTAIKDPKDTAFVFWVISIGIINGVAYYQLSIVATLFIAGVLMMLSRTAVFEPSYVLILKYSQAAREKLEALLEKYCDKYYTRSDTRKKEITEKVVEVRIKQEAQEDFLQEMNALEGVEKCVLLANNGEIAE